jgi:ribosomal protein L37AE/L43A
VHETELNEYLKLAMLSVCWQLYEVSFDHLQKRIITHYVMQKVNMLLFYRLSQLWNQEWLAELFEKVRANFSAYEDGSVPGKETKEEIELDDELLEEILGEEEEDARARASGQYEGQVNHNACSVCQHEEASPSSNPVFLCMCCSRRFHRLCHTPQEPLVEDHSLWVCEDCDSTTSHNRVEEDWFRYFGLYICTLFYILATTKDG